MFDSMYWYFLYLSLARQPSARPHILPARAGAARGSRLRAPVAAGEEQAVPCPSQPGIPFAVTHAIISWNLRSVGSVSAREVT